MAKPKNKSTTLPSHRPSWPFNWSEFDRTFENFRRDLEHTFSSFPSISMPSMPKIPTTSCDVLDEGKNLRVTMDVPGVKKNEINLNVTDNSIEISAQHKEAKEEKKKNFLRKERSEVSYYRALPLPEKVVASKVKAKLTDGVLDIELPKIQPTTKQSKRTIPIQ